MSTDIKCLEDSACFCAASGRRGFSTAAGRGAAGRRRGRGPRSPRCDEILLRRMTVFLPGMPLHQIETSRKTECAAGCFAGLMAHSAGLSAKPGTIKMTEAYHAAICRLLWYASALYHFSGTFAAVCLSGFLNRSLGHIKTIHSNQWRFSNVLNKNDLSCFSCFPIFTADDYRLNSFI